MHFLNATIDIGAKDYDAALKELNEVQKSVTNDPLLYLNFAVAYAGQKKYAEAEREFQTALKMYPQYDTALADYVSLMFATNNPAKAMALASQYAAANPNRAAAHFIYGSALASTRKFDQAIQEYQKVVQLDPKSLMAYVHIGQIYELTNRPDDAWWPIPEGPANSADLTPGEQLSGESLCPQRRFEVGWESTSRQP